MTVRTRFAPSPTGYLHIGGARTALFNYLFAKANDGEFFLRIEDTDRKRSTDDAIAAILYGMKWLGLKHDGEVVYQYSNQKRHQEIAMQLLESGNAYKCYLNEQELQELREESRATGKAIRSPWRDKLADTNAGDYVIRIKAPNEGQIVIEDKVQGKVSVDCTTLDDMVLLRSDGTPTYMLAVVVDDYDMQISHVIRGDDHFTNGFRQALIYQAMGWQMPIFAHVPLIHGADGAKLSKRHGAVGVDQFEKDGYLPEAVRNYILRLGWSHGDDEIISDEQALAWFNLENLNKSPARFDYVKLDSLNNHYINELSDEDLFAHIKAGIANSGINLIDNWQEVVTELLPLLKDRAKTLNDITADSLKYVNKELPTITDEDKLVLTDEKFEMLKGLFNLYANTSYNSDDLNNATKEFLKEKGLKMGEVGPALRVALLGVSKSPAIFKIMEILGKSECERRFLR